MPSGVFRRTAHLDGRRDLSASQCLPRTVQRELGLALLRHLGTEEAALHRVGHERERRLCDHLAVRRPQVHRHTPRDRRATNTPRQRCQRAPTPQRTPRAPTTSPTVVACFAYYNITPAGPLPCEHMAHLTTWYTSQDGVAVRARLLEWVRAMFTPTECRASEYRVSLTPPRRRPRQGWWQRWGCWRGCQPRTRGRCTSARPGCRAGRCPGGCRTRM